MLLIDTGFDEGITFVIQCTLHPGVRHQIFLGIILFPPLFAGMAAMQVEQAPTLAPRDTQLDRNEKSRSPHLEDDKRIVIAVLTL